jgi:hypothetical protein
MHSSLLNSIPQTKPVKAEEEKQHAPEKKVARKRIALVISNSNTQEGISHANAAQVGATIEEALHERLSFDVELVCNASKEEMDAAISRFVAKAGENQPCDTLFFFFGYGAEHDGSSYLFECDKNQEEARVNLGEDVVKRLNDPFVRHPDAVNMIILDCSRHEHDHTTWRCASVTNAHERFRHAHCAVGSSQFLIMFATAPGAKAAPGLLTKEFVETLMGPVNEQSPQRIDELFMEVSKSVSSIGKQQKQPQEPWCHTGGLKRHFYLDVEKNNAQVGTGQSYARVPADTPQIIMLSGEKEKKIMVAILGEYRLLGAWHSKPYYCSDKDYHLFYLHSKMHTGWCIDQYLGYAPCCAFISHFISC